MRRLSFDLRGALAQHGGVVRNVEVVLSSPSAPEGVLRVVCTVEVLAVGARASSDLLEEVGVDGALETLSGGWLSGWFQAGARSDSKSGWPCSSTANPSSCASRAWPGTEAERPPVSGGSPSIWATCGDSADGPGGRVSVRVAGSNVPLRGGSLTVADVGHDLRYDDAVSGWVEIAVERRPLVRRVRARVGRVVRSGMGSNRRPL